MTTLRETPSGCVPPILQASRHDGCEQATAAWISTQLGYPATEAGVLAWRDADGRHVTSWYPHKAHGLSHFRYHMVPGGPPRRHFWFREPHSAQWCRDWLAAGAIAHVLVFRIPTMSHAVALVDVSDDGKEVLIMDPLQGFVAEPWDWFRGRPEQSLGHHIDGWFWNRSNDVEASNRRPQRRSVGDP